jgi:hypothetical protein
MNQGKFFLIVSSCLLLVCTAHSQKIEFSDASIFLSEKKNTRLLKTAQILQEEILSCQYPVPDWDLAFAMTLGRECINPRPLDEKYIHNLYAGLASGSISYSEGTNDDVNIFVWTGQDWDSSTPVLETLRDYARYFIVPDYTEGVAQGLIALEKNFKGPLLTNDNVERTFHLTGVDWVHEIVARGFEGQTTPLAWMNQINTLYDTPLEIEYDNLDTSAVYTLKIAYTGRFRSKMKLVADGVTIHDYIRMGTRPMFEFVLPEKVTHDGRVLFTWTCGSDDTGEGERGSQVAEIWLIRKPGFAGADLQSVP